MSFKAKDIKTGKTINLPDNCKIYNTDGTIEVITKKGNYATTVIHRKDGTESKAKLTYDCMGELVCMSIVED